jgi:hypothetical protein
LTSAGMIHSWMLQQICSPPPELLLLCSWDLHPHRQIDLLLPNTLLHVLESLWSNRSRALAAWHKRSRFCDLEPNTCLLLVCSYAYEEQINICACLLLISPNLIVPVYIFCKNILINHSQFAKQKKS